MRIAIALVVACSGSNHPAPAPAVVKMKVEVAPSIATEPAPIEALGVERLPVVRFTKSTVLRKAPDLAADDVGTIRKDARAAVLDEAPAGNGCRTRWILLAPRGWACDITTEPTTQSPTQFRAYALTDEDPAPPVSGVYGVVRGKNVVAYDSAGEAEAGEGRALVGNNSVRAAGSVTVNGQRFWRTTGGDLIPASAIATFSPSKYRGVIIEDAMPAWVRGHGAPRDPVITRAEPSARAKPTGELAARTVVSILEERDGFVRVADAAWIARRDVRVAQRMAPPEVATEGEKWFDIDLDEQVLVAYEGERPVYATLVSTGKAGRHTTPVVVTRIASKLERTTMASDKQDVYSVADVPWTMFYDGNYALHTSYWHDGFGSVRSHGCINLSPHDARLLFRWSSPDVPPGWTSVRGDKDNPGSLVRVRSAKQATPRLRGYAREMTGSVAAR